MEMSTKDLLCNFFEAAFSGFTNKRNWCESFHRSTLLSVSACRRILADGMHKVHWFDWSPDLEEDNCSPNQRQFVSDSVQLHMEHD